MPGPDRHEMLEQHRSHNHTTGVAIAADKVPTTDGAGGFTYEDRGGSGVSAHDELTHLDVPGDHPWALVNAGGEGHVQAIIADAGSTETLDLATANVFDITLTTGCTLTLAPPTDDGKARAWSLIFRGSFTVVWPASVVWLDGGGTAPSAAATLAVELVTLDGGVSYLASAGRGGTHTLNDLTDVVITSPADDDFLRYNGSNWVNESVSITSSSGGTDHAHRINVFNGDAATTVFEISDEPLDPEQVFAFVGGSWTAITVSGTMNTTITFGSAPGSGTGNVVVQYPAVVA